MSTETPAGLHLRHTLRGHEGQIYEIAWSPDGRRLASSSVDRTVRIWNVEEEAEVGRLEGHVGSVLSVAWSSGGKQLVSASSDRTVRLWDVQRREALAVFEQHTDRVYSAAWAPQGPNFASGSADATVRVWNSTQRRLKTTLEAQAKVPCVAWSPTQHGLLASGSADGIVRLWDVRKGERQRLQGHTEQVNALAWAPGGRYLASGSVDRTVRLWDTAAGVNSGVLEGHGKNIECVRFSADGKLLASKAADDTVRLWWCEARVLVATLPEPMGGNFLGGLAFHPRKRLLATLGEGERIIRVWRLDLAELQAEAALSDTRHYRNAKVVLVGDANAGKSALALRLRGQPFQATQSTHGRVVWPLEEAEATGAGGRKETRETLLWDLGGQPGYRLIHQLHLGEITAALVVFALTSRDDPFESVRYWDRALRQARGLGSDPEDRGPLRKFLVAAQVEIGGVSNKQLQTVAEELGFDRYFATSAVQGLQVPELRQAVREAIDWDRLPQVSSTQLFHTIRGFLRSQQRLLAPVDELFAAFCAEYRPLAGEGGLQDLRGLFETCIGRLESRGLVHRLNFGNLVLLRPELLDAYASAMVIAAAKTELGALRQEDVFAGSVSIPDEVSIASEQAALLVRATVEELIAHELVLREQTEDGAFLVFPSESWRSWPRAPTPRTGALSFTYEGATVNIYTTLVFRLAHSGSFTATMERIWRNSVLFETADGTCGLHRRRLGDGKDELTLLYDPHTPAPLRAQFETFVEKHLRERALPDTVAVHLSYPCPVCGSVVEKFWRHCSACGAQLPPLAPSAAFPDVALGMDRAVQYSRDYLIWDLAATTEVHRVQSKPDATIAIAFTDVVGSVALAGAVGDERMLAIQEAHFRRVRELLAKLDGREINALGDGFLATFPTAATALDFALELYCDTGYPMIAVRVGVHVVVASRVEDDIFGSAVNYAVRVCGKALGAEIWLSDRAHGDLAQSEAARHRDLRWREHRDVTIQEMPGSHLLWSLSEVPCGDAEGARKKGPKRERHENLRRKMSAGDFDVFLSYSSHDQSAVQEIAWLLADQGILPWFDEWEVRPGSSWQRVLEEQIRAVKAAAVFVGKKPLGSWQSLEMRAFLQEFVERACPLIPVLLADCGVDPELPPFLRQFAWVDFRKPESEPLGRLIWGITGQRPG